MTKPKKIGDLLKIALVLLGFNALAGEPYYNGRPMSDCLLHVLRDPAARQALQQIGTNGVPTLIEILTVKPGTRRKLLAKLGSVELRQEFRGRDSFLDLEELRSMAVDGFEVLGTN